MSVFTLKEQSKRDTGTAHSNGPRLKSDKSPGAGPGTHDVHIGSPGVPPVADLGRYEGDGDCTTPSSEEGRVDNILFPFCFVQPLAP